MEHGRHAAEDGSVHVLRAVSGPDDHHLTR